MYGSGALRTIAIEGPIEHGDFDKFIRLVKENQGRINGVALFSPGGDFEEAMRIGHALRVLDLESMVPSLNDRGLPLCGTTDILPKPKDPKNCIAASAAFFIHIGAVERSGLHIVVHRPYFGSKAFGKLPEREAKKAFNALQDVSKAYMDEMGVPKRVQEDVLGTASDQGLVLDEKTVRTYFLGTLPYYHEWIRSRCGQLTDQESQRLEEYTQRIVSNRNPSKTALTDEESADLGLLNRKRQEETHCEISASKERRLASYAKYFGAKPDDSSNYNFSRWTDPVRYLGRPFDELLAEERFDEEKFAGMFMLKRLPTATTPRMQIYDSKQNPRTVKSLSVLSAPNPSVEFKDRLVVTLETAWGKPSSASANTREWATKTFFATLELDFKSGEGSAELLHIEGR
jgi:hypothetical protein